MCICGSDRKCVRHYSGPGPTRSCHVMSVRILYMQTVLSKVAMRVFVGLMPVSFWLMLLVLCSRALSWVSISILKCWVAALPTSQLRDWEQTVLDPKRSWFFYMWACEEGQKLQWSVVLYLLYKIYLAIRINWIKIYQYRLKCVLLNGIFPLQMEKVEFVGTCFFLTVPSQTWLWTVWVMGCT